eukprot:Tbor_TRINITY_DN2621_c0_g1::TRINITY_DN2621_c0_g1_i1::g.17923::m.17923/K14838/NOP15; nucleolar protein 15
MAPKKSTTAMKTNTTVKPVMSAKKAPVTKGTAAKKTVSTPQKKRITIVAPEGIVMATKAPSTEGKSTPKDSKKKDTSVKRKHSLTEKSTRRNGSNANGEKHKKTKKTKGDETTPHYSVLQLRHLPEEFEEPQLIRFFSQFGARVVNTYCVRNQKNHKSKGIAYVQFDKEDVIPHVVEECHGMLLGGFTVRARKVRMNRPMPNKLKIINRRKKAFDISAKGMELKRFDLGEKQAAAAKEDIKKVVGYLIKYANNEKKNNERNNKVFGIDYTFDGFQSQLKKVDRKHFVKPAKKPKTVEKEEEVSEQDSDEVEDDA